MPRDGQGVPIAETREPRARRALITGASAGIGRALSIELTLAGVEVFGVGRDAGALEATREQAGAGSFHPLSADITVAMDRGTIRERLGAEPVDILVHGAGIFPRGPLERLSMDSWHAAMATNVDARLQLVMVLREQLIGGRVLFIGSDAARTPRTGGAAYSVSKAASEMLYRCLSLELADRISFAIAKPGLVATRMMDESIQAPRSEFPAGEVYERMEREGETIAPETIARFFRWLLVDLAPEEFAGSWDVRDEDHHARWLAGPLYRGRTEPGQGSG